MMHRRGRTFKAGWLAAGVLTVGVSAFGLALQPDRPPGQPGQPPPGRGPQGQPRGDRPFENVEGAMKAINGGLRRLKASIADPAQKDQSLQAIWRMQAACVFAKGATPGDHAPDAARLEEYRRAQIKLMGMLLECETAILDGDAGKAKGVIAAMEAHRDATHKSFNVRDEEGPNPRRPGGGGAGGGGGGGGEGGGGR